MKTRDELIEEYISEPIKVGDDVIVTYDYTEKKLVKVKGKSQLVEETIGKTYNGTGVVTSVFDESYVVTMDESAKSVPLYGEYTSPKHITLPKHIVSKNTIKIGYDPFPKKSWSDVSFYALSLDSLLFKLGYGGRVNTFKSEKFGEVNIPKMNWNPFIVDENGIEIGYQREFVWSLNDKQLLIDSIYNGIEIGKIVIRARSFEWVEKRVKEGKIHNTAFYDIVDGKQRSMTILEFIENKFPDSYGYYFKDLSELAKIKFYNFSSLTFAEMGEGSTDEDVKSVFLNINFTGVPMSKEHIDFVKTINL